MIYTLKVVIEENIIPKEEIADFIKERICYKGIHYISEEVKVTLEESEKE